MRANKSLTVILLLMAFAASQSAAQKKETVWTAAEKPIVDQIRGLRALPDDVRASTTKDLAMKISELPAGANKLRLATGLANLSTEGDFGHDTLQEVATTLAGALKQHPVPWAQPDKATDDATTKAATQRQPADEYMELATLVRYEHVNATVDDPQFAAAMHRLEAEDAQRQHPEFTLKDLSGKGWTFTDLSGKVVLVNFWATWCPPCRKEMPDLEKLYERFQSQGLVVLAISDEEAAKVLPFIQQRGVRFPVLLDTGRKVNEMFAVNGIPKTFVYDREGKLAAQSIDMRTEKQFLEMLSAAGLK